MADNAYATPWRVLLGTVVLLDWSDLVEREPRLKSRRLVQTVQPIRALSEVLIPRGNVGYSVTFQRIVACDTSAAARALVASHAAELDGITEAQTLTIYMAGGYEVMTISGALIAANGYDAWCEANWFYANYEISGGALAYGNQTTINPDSGMSYPAVVAPPAWTPAAAPQLSQSWEFPAVVAPEGEPIDSAFGVNANGDLVIRDPLPAERLNGFITDLDGNLVPDPDSVRPGGFFRVNSTGDLQLTL